MNTWKKMNLRIAVMIFLWAGLTTNSSAKLNPMQESLRGVKEITVDVICSDDIKETDLKQQEISKEIEAQVRQGGIKIVSGENRQAVSDRCRLIVLIKVYTPSELKTFIYNLKVYFVQTVTIQRIPDVKIDAVTWELSWLSHGSKGRLNEAIPANLKIMTDNFIKDYQLANLKGVSSGNYDSSIVSIAADEKQIRSGVEVQYKYISSKNSQVFHSPECRSAKRIKPENLVSYISRDEAIAAGKRPCKVCKP